MLEFRPSHANEICLNSNQAMQMNAGISVISHDKLLKIVII